MYIIFVPKWDTYFCASDYPSALDFIREMDKLNISAKLFKEV